ncbi:MAG: DUF4349 domain-containing protein [Solirubrobacterales bacterium]|nr:DUF4349 domain-containing protein [Solirubrobacterales bacterium]
MSSRRINETEQHELDVIDAIVRGGGEARPEDAALTDFALLVRNARPVPNHGEVAALDARAQEAAAKRRPRERSILKPMLVGASLLFLMGGATSVAILSASDMSAGPMSALAPTTEGDDSAASGQVSSDLVQRVATGESATSTAPAPGMVPEEITSSRVPREIARDTRLTLAADGADIERLSDRVNAIVDRYGGYVASSRVRGGEGNSGRATFALMIPAAQYKPALASISKLAHVRSRSQSSEDITTAVNSADRQLDRTTARANRLGNQLEAAETPAQRAALGRQLARANSAKRAAARQVRANRARVNYVPIALTILADKTAANKDKGEIAKAFDKAGEILTAVAAALIIVLAALIPIALIGAALWFGTRRFKRSRIERTIESATAIQPE